MKEGKMFYSERDAIDIYERKYSIQEIWWMDEDDRLLFAPVRRNRNRIRNIVRNAVEAIELGIPMPPIFIFHRRDGIWDVIDFLFWNPKIPYIVCYSF